MKPLDDVIRSLEEIREKYPELNSQTFAYGKLELVIRNGVLVSVGPNPCLQRGKEFGLHVEWVDRKPIR